MHKILATFLLFAAAVAAVAQEAEYVPNRFILEMAAISGKDGRSAAIQKQSVRAAVESRGNAVRDSLDKVVDALVVDAPDADAAALAGIPGVRKVHRVRIGRIEMNRAPAIVGAPGAWRISGGQDTAGRGIRIGIVDTGIDTSHPAFQDDTLEPPAGFPKANREEDLASTSKKVIVFRNYESGARAVARDMLGHGTAVASVAAGVRHMTPVGEFSGIAPGAFLGAYKLDEQFGVDSLLRALEDAVNDGMDVVNLSVGIFPPARPEEDLLTQAVDRMVGRGVIVSKSAGNYGPDPGMGSSPMSAGAISAGAIFNDRFLGPTVAAGGTSYPASAPDTVLPDASIEGSVADVARLDPPSGLACTAMAGGTLEGRIALIQRGTCTFEEKLNNAARAGAKAAIIFTDDRPVALLWSIGAATLPALMIPNETGLQLRQAANAEGGLSATLDFHYGAVPQDPLRVTSFSSRGPGLGNTILPEVSAVGEDVFMATQKENPAGEIYSPNGYAVEGGTSFSSPMVGGAAAVLKAARPNLNVRQYKSLLVNSAASLVQAADGRPYPVMAGGAGVLNVEAAVRSPLVAEPVALSFGAPGPTADITREVVLTNIGTAPDTFGIAVTASGDGPVPVASPNTMTLAPGQSQSIAVRFRGSNLTPGAYDGFLLVRGTLNEVDTRIPYWYGASDRAARTFALIPRTTTPRAGGRFSMFLRIADASGAAVVDAEPTVEATGGGGSVERVQLVDDTFPGFWLVDVRLGTLAGELNTFRFRMGDATRTIGIRP